MKKIISVLLVLSVIILSGCTVSSAGKSISGEIEGKLGSGTFQSFGCNKVGNIVTAAARYYGLDNEATNDVACFQLPDGFRPVAALTCNGYICTDGVAVPVFLNISTSGTVSVSYSQTKTMTQVFFSATFPAQ